MSLSAAGLRKDVAAVAVAAAPAPGRIRTRGRAPGLGRGREVGAAAAAPTGKSHAPTVAENVCVEREGERERV